MRQGRNIINFMENQTNTPSELNTPSALQPQTPPVQNDKRKKTVLIISVVIALLIIVAGVVTFVTLSHSADKEQQAYEVLENNDNPIDYEAFLADYPNSKHASEVKERLAKLMEMLQKWNTVMLSDNVNDFINFKQTYNDPKYVRLCDIKIDSLDFVKAGNEGTEEAYMRYLAAHPEGRYASEASLAQGQIRDQEVSNEDREQIISLINTFYTAFASQDDDGVCQNIAATMKNFLHQKNANKVQVMNTIHVMFNEHIQSCTFTVNRDFQITRIPSGNNSEATYNVVFTVDQRIQRDNEGKTFGQYKCTAEVTSHLLITSLTMEEISKQ